MKTTIGLIGYGDFGRLIIKFLSKDHDFEVFSRSAKESNTKSVSFVSLNKCVNNKYIILATPLSAYKKILQQISKSAPKNAVVIDVCSVKVEPQRLAKKYLRSDIGFIGTHPLFGPQSATNSLKNHKIVICTQNKTSFANNLESYLSKLGLKVIHLTAQEHDKQMAEVQALTFFVARGLMNTHLHKNILTTPSFKKLLDLAELESHHSDALFNTIQTGNPYAKTARNKFIAMLKQLNKKIK